MKKLAILFLLIPFLMPAMAQSPLNLGIKAGYNSSKLTTDLSQFDEGRVNNFHAGAFARVNLGNIYVQPEAYFSSKGGDIDAIDSPNSFDLKTLDVPVLLGVKIFNIKAANVRANAGPVFCFVTDKKYSGSDFERDDFKNSFLAWQYGVGADFLFLTLDIRMENSSGDLYKGPELDSKSKSFVVSLGFKIL
jgi:hypothetical protein